MRMTTLLDHLQLERTGPAEAAVGLCSLPLPREAGRDLSLDHAASGMQPVAWWERHKVPRRALCMVVDNNGLPDTLRLHHGQSTSQLAASTGWQAASRITREKLEFTPHKFTDIASLRGVPAEECTIIEGELALTYGGRSISLQFGATGPRGGPYYWQNVQLDALWSNAVCQAVRVGGDIYNEDTYLRLDVYLLLFSNGVAHIAAHFVNTKLHIEGYDFQGLPVIRIGAESLSPRALSPRALSPVQATIPRDGMHFDLGMVRLNTSDSALLAGPEYPGTITGSKDEVLWYPVSRIFNPQVEVWPETEWAPGFARTVRFQLSLSDAPPLVARYRIPSWWYALSGEPWPWGYLPVKGRFSRLSELTADDIRKQFMRGRFDGGSAGFGNDGDAGIGMMHAYYHTGRAELFEDALSYCYYWADLAVDHRDYTVHQWVGGYPWKTCAYNKFRDVLCGYLETGDPNLLDTAEMAAEAYWTWFRANWPRCAVGRDTFEAGGWALLWRYLGTEHARERTLELARMIGTVLETRGTIGGQMGTGPHPGYHSSLYMTGVCMVSLLEVAEAAIEAGNHDSVAHLLRQLRTLEAHYSRDDVELFPSEHGLPRRDWGTAGHATWAALGARIYPEMMRLAGTDDDATRRGLRRSAVGGADNDLPSLEEWAHTGRRGNHLINPLYHDALLLGASLSGDGIEVAPIGDPHLWPAEQTVATPYGDLKVTTVLQDEQIELHFQCPAAFPVWVRYRGSHHQTHSQGNGVLE